MMKMNSMAGFNTNSLQGEVTRFATDSFEVPTWVQLHETKTIDDYAKDGGLEVVWHLCSFYQDPLRS